MQHPLPLSWLGASTLRLHRNHFLLKKHPFSPEFVECVNLRILTHGQEMHSHFWPCQLCFFTPLILTECQRQAVYFSVKIMWVLAISPIFIQNCHKTLTISMSSFPMQLKTCNNKPKKRGKSRPLVESSFFVLFQQQKLVGRGEVGEYFLTD